MIIMEVSDFQDQVLQALIQINSQLLEFKKTIDILNKHSTLDNFSHKEVTSSVMKNAFQIDQIRKGLFNQDREWVRSKLKTLFCDIKLLQEAIAFYLPEPTPEELIKNMDWKLSHLKSIVDHMCVSNKCTPNDRQLLFLVFDFIERELGEVRQGLEMRTLEWCTSKSRSILGNLEGVIGQVKDHLQGDYDGLSKEQLAVLGESPKDFSVCNDPTCLDCCYSPPMYDSSPEQEDEMDLTDYGDKIIKFVKNCENRHSALILRASRLSRKKSLTGYEEYLDLIDLCEAIQLRMWRLEKEVNFEMEDWINDQKVVVLNEFHKAEDIVRKFERA